MVRLLGVSALLFAGSVVGTVVQCGSMSTMAGMPMPGGWTLSTVWMRMPGRSWPDTGASFVGTWVLMMVAMMLPALIPTLAHYFRETRGAGATRSGGLTALVGMGYFAVWASIGMGVFPVGAALAAVEMNRPIVARAVPLAVGVVVLAAGLLQLTPWKARRLAGCRRDARCGGAVPARAHEALRHGARVGVHCAVCCAGPMAIQVALGVMDLRLMAAVAAAISLERLAPAGRRVAQATGVVALVGGLALTARSAGFVGPEVMGSGQGDVHHLTVTRADLEPGVIARTARGHDAVHVHRVDASSVAEHRGGRVEPARSSAPARSANRASGSSAGRLAAPAGEADLERAPRAAPALAHLADVSAGGPLHQRLR